MKVTIKDISKKTGISCSTISRVLTGNGYVKEETRDIVESAFAELGYKSSSKKRLANNLSQLVLVVVEDITNHFYAGLIKGLDEVLSAHDYKVLLCNSDYNPAKEEEYIAYANSCGFRGIVMITVTETTSLIRLLDNISCPVVMVNRYLRSRDLDAICIDNYRGGYLATRYLIEMGHTRIAHLSGPMSSSASQDRYRGFVDALADEGIPLEPSMIYNGNLKLEKGYEFAEYYAKSNLGFTGVFCANDIMARAFIDRLRSFGFVVPGDVSVIAFDETQMAVEGGVQITNVGKSPVVMGRAAAETLLERIQNMDGDPRKIVFPPEINVRESVKNLCK